MFVLHPPPGMAQPTSPIAPISASQVKVYTDVSAGASNGLNLSANAYNRVSN